MHWPFLYKGSLVMAGFFLCLRFKLKHHYFNETFVDQLSGLPDSHIYFFLAWNFKLHLSLIDLQCCVLYSKVIQLYMYMCMCGQSCPAFGNFMDCSPPGSSVHGIFQARILKQLAIFYSKGSSWPKDTTHISCASCIGRQILYYTAPSGKPYILMYIYIYTYSCSHSFPFYIITRCWIQLAVLYSRTLLFIYSV